MREIHIVYAEVMKAHILFDGRRLTHNRVEYKDLDELLDTLKTFDPKKIRAYIENYDSDEEDHIKERLEGTFKRVDYGNGVHEA